MSKKTPSIYSPVLNIDDIRAPFPPTITADDLLSRPNGTSKRVPCAFIIYRMSFHRELKSRGFKLSWRQISPMASKAWNNESEEVKQAYTDLCYETKARYNEYSSRDQSDTVADVAAEIAVADYNAADLHMIGETTSNGDVNPYDFNNYITTENGND